MPALRSVNVGRPRTFDHHGRRATSAIWKEPVTGPVAVRGVNLDGDDQADRTVHGGPDKAVYAYAVEDHAAFRAEGFDVGPGTFGENLTIEGLDVSGARVGEHWQVGSVRLEVSEPRVPCFKLGARMGDPAFVRTFAEARRPGCYLRIVEEGVLEVGDAVEVVARPDHDLTVREVFEIYLFRREDAGRLLEVPAVSAAWRAWAELRA